MKRIFCLSLMMLLSFGASVALAKGFELSFFLGIADTQSLTEDGVSVRFIVEEGEGKSTKVFEQHWAKAEWSNKFVVDLTPWAGQTIRLNLTTDPGPARNPSWDWILIGDAKITFDEKLVYDIGQAVTDGKAKLSMLLDGDKYETNGLCHIPYCFMATCSPYAGTCGGKTKPKSFMQHPAAGCNRAGNTISRYEIYLSRIGGTGEINPGEVKANSDVAFTFLANIHIEDSVPIHIVQIELPMGFTTKGNPVSSINIGGTNYTNVSELVKVQDSTIDITLPEAIEKDTNLVVIFNATTHLIGRTKATFTVSFLDSSGNVLGYCLPGNADSKDNNNSLSIACPTCSPEQEFRVLTNNPNNPNILLAGSAEGMFRSQDSGTTWRHVWKNDQGRAINALAISPADPDFIIAGLLGPTGDSRPLKPTLLRSLDGGFTWKLAGYEGITDIFSLAPHPTKPGIFYMAERDEWFAGDPGGLYRTLDYGERWQKVWEKNKEPNENATFKDDSIRVLATISRPDGTIALLAGLSDGVYQSTDDGVNWNELTKGDPDVTAIAVRKTDTETIYVGTESFGMFRSLDGGKKWEPLSGWPVDAGPIKTIVINPKNPGVVYVGTKTGFFRSEDGGETWQGKGLSGLVGNTIYNVAVVPISPTESMIFSATKNGIISFVDVIPPLAKLHPPITISPEPVFEPLLQWKEVQGAYSYTVQVSTDENFSDIIFTLSEYTELSAKVPSEKLKVGKTYYWRVRAENPSAISEWSNVETFTYSRDIQYPLWDVNQDGVVDIFDIVLVGTHFGEDYTTGAPVISDDVGKLRSLQAEGKIWMEPLQRMDSEGFLSVAVRTSRLEDLYGYQFDILFDHEILEVYSIVPDSTLNQDRAQTYWRVSSLDNLRGYIIGVTHVRQGTKEGITGDGILAIVQFRVKQPVIAGDTELLLSNVEVADSKARRILVNFSGVRLNRELFIPQKTVLHQNYPNPFNPETWIPFNLAEDAVVIIQIFDMRGNLVRRFNLGQVPAGYHISRDRAVYWDGRNEKGEKVASGTYFYTLQVREAIPNIGAGKFNATRKMVIVK